MTYLDYAAFDPIFMLHHAMVDRLFAMWQVLNPDSYVEPQIAGSSTFVVTQGTTLTETTPLTPFNYDSSTFYTADQVRQTEALGYEYPETKGALTNNVTQNVLSAINTLYPPTNTTWPPVTKRDLQVTSRDIAGYSSHYEWVATVAVDKNSVDGSILVALSWGTLVQDASLWLFEPNFIRPCPLIIRSGTNNSDVQYISGTIPITGPLLDVYASGNLSSLDPDPVKAYLSANLYYAVTVNGQIVPNGNFTSLSIKVVSALVETPPAGTTELWEWALFEDQYELSAMTVGK